MSGMQGHIEKWLLEFEQSMRRTIKGYIDQAYQAYAPIESSSESVLWLYQWPVQVVQLVTRLKWTAEVEDAIRLKKLQVSPPSLSVQS